MSLEMAINPQLTRSITPLGVAVYQIETLHHQLVD